jgi:uncharacterized membrane protein
MPDNWLFVVTYAAALGCALLGGVFFAFSGFVMRGLGRTSPEHGIPAMQSINVAAVRPPLMIALFGTALLCVIAAVAAVLRWRSPASGYLIGGALLYLAGAVLVTVLFNVPRNNTLASVDPASSDGGGVWADYLLPGPGGTTCVRSCASPPLPPSSRRCASCRFLD